MSNHQLLDNISHKDVRIIRQRGADYGDNVSITTVFPIEFRQLQNHYPIFFKKNAETGQFETVVLLGFAQDENLFLDGNDWRSSYLPLSMQRQPFLIGFQHSVENGVAKQTPVVHIDMAHPRVSFSAGEPVFLAQGGNSPLLDQINSILHSIHQGHAQSARFCSALLELDLIEALTLAITLNNGEQINLQGLYTINEDRLNALTAEALGLLHGQGYLQHLYMMQASLANISTMVALKNATLA